jgi:DNA invertase Pin-like site-specific DNA recombinase
MAAFAEYEREMIRERVKAGVRNAQAKGKRLGRPRRVFRRDEALEMRTLVQACSEIPGIDAGEKRSKQRHVA